MNNIDMTEVFASAPTSEQVSKILQDVASKVANNNNAEVYKFCHSVVDLTTLNSADSVQSVREFARSAVDFTLAHPDIPAVASLCVYPPFVEVVGMEVDGTALRITSVAGAFPSSQTFMEVKALECAMAVESGADEVDVVLNVGMMMSGECDEAAAEIELLRAEVGDDTTLKVIIESGVLNSPELIYAASLLSAQAGADFVKTSTGKVSPAATPQAVVVMCLAVKSYAERCGRMVGVKVAGGVSSVEDAVLYYTIVSEILGDEWLSAHYFRIGASSLSSALVEAIER